MQVFAVFNIPDPGTVQTRLEEHYPGHYIDAYHGAFFVCTTGETSQQMGEKLGFGTENLSSGIVMPVTTYWGRADPNLWEWIHVKMESDGK